MTGLDELVDNICNAEYEYISYEGKRERTRIAPYERGAKQAISKCVYDWANKQISSFEAEKRIGMLEAKVYVYEQIIANSNFAPMIPPAPEESIMKYEEGLASCP